VDRDLEGDGVLMCQPMGATCASHDAGQRPAHPGGYVGSLNAARYTPPTGAGGPRTQVAAWGSLNAARYTPPTEAGGPRTQVAAWGRSTRPATRRLPGPEARVPRWLQWNPYLIPILSVQAVYHPASAARTPQSPRLRGEGGMQMLAHQDPPFSRIGLV